MGPFTPQVLAAKGGVPPDTGTPRDRRDAKQTSAARLDPEQPRAAGRAGRQGHHCGRPGPCSQGPCRPLPAEGTVTMEKSPGKQPGCLGPSLRSATGVVFGDVSQHQRLRETIARSL